MSRPTLAQLEQELGGLWPMYKALQAENTRLTSEVARLSKDAARYCWLRKIGDAQSRAGHYAETELDKFVDAALAKPPVDCPF